MIAYRLEGKNVLVTGGSSGIGLETCRLLKECGAVVAVLSNDQEQLDDVRDEFCCYRADVRDVSAVTRAVDDFKSQAGSIDMLANCAGVSHWCDFLEMDEEFWDKIYDINVKGTFIVSQAVARHMVKQESGVIINVSSMSGVLSGELRATAYTSCKWAIVGFTRSLNLELKPLGIRVCCFCPGSTLTDIHIKAGNPHQEKMMDPKFVAEALVFMLAMPEKCHIQELAMPATFEMWR